MSHQGGLTLSHIFRVVSNLWYYQSVAVVSCLTRLTEQTQTHLHRCMSTAPHKDCLTKNWHFTFVFVMYGITIVISANHSLMHNIDILVFESYYKFLKNRFHVQSNELNIKDKKSVLWESVLIQHAAKLFSIKVCNSLDIVVLYHKRGYSVTALFHEYNIIVCTLFTKNTVIETCAYVSLLDKWCRYLHLCESSHTPYLNSRVGFLFLLLRVYIYNNTCYNIIDVTFAK